MKRQILSKALKSCFAILIAVIFASANPIHADEQKKTVLILNSYHEDELWGNEMINPLRSHLAHNDDIDCEIIYLNNSIVTDSTVYKTVSNSVFEMYQDNHPDYVVMLGNFAFNLRDRMKEEWGEDIPFLLVSRVEGFGKLNDYFATLDNHVNIETRTPLAEVRDQYNFTAIFVPDNCKSTIDLMVDLIPDMEELVFIADVSYVNRVASYRIYNYLLEEYPKIKFKWVMAAEENSEKFRDLMVNRYPKTGILLSSWTYDTMSTRGFPVLTSSDLALISTSVNPIFTLRQAYLNYGTIGGVFTDNEGVKNDIIRVVDDMIAGKSMRDVPFYDATEKGAFINYRVFQNFGYKEKDCPKGTTFIGKPETYWERYWLVIILIVILACTAISFMFNKNKEQRRKIDILNRHFDFIQNMPIPYTNAEFKMDKKGNVVDIKLGRNNQAYVKMLEANSLPEDADTMFPSQTIGEKVQKLIEMKTPVMFTYYFEHTDKFFDIMLRLVKVTNNSDGTTSVNVDAFARDITNRQKMQDALKKTASQLDMTINIAKLVPWQLNWKTKVLTFDSDVEYVKQAIQYYVNGELKLDEYIKRVLPEDVEVVRKAMEDLGSGAIKEFKIQYRIHYPNDPNRIDWVENCGAVTEYGDDGKPDIITGSLQVITEAKDKEEKLEKALIKANESDKMKSAFLANMSHEIRTPLNAIVGFSSMMVKAKDENARYELSKVINKNNDLLLNLINDVLDLAKIESNTVELVMGVCDIDDLLESIGKTMSIRIPKGVKLNIVHYTDRCTVETDAARLSQLLINLLTNSCKFTTKGNITVGYEIHEPEGMLYFFVKDTGIGISKDKQEHIFDQFVKLNTFIQGTGLGLAICRSLVEKMGGEIGVHSDGEGRGSMFWFTLPYKPVDIHNEQVEEKILEDDEKDERIESGTMRVVPLTDAIKNDGVRKTVLVAEDNDSNYWLLQQILNDRYNMIWAKDGLEAVKLYKEHQPDFIIMDINMPNLDGYGAVKEIRELSETVPIIAVTAYAFASDRIKILNSGFNAYVSKPLSEAALFEAINHVLDGNSEMP